MPEELLGVDLNEPEEYNDNSAGYKFTIIFGNLIFSMFIFPFIYVAIVLEDIKARITCTIIGSILTILLIKLNKKKKTRRIQ